VVYIIEAALRAVFRRPFFLAFFEPFFLDFLEPFLEAFFFFAIMVLLEQ
jgi:hypothetical protein